MDRSKIIHIAQQFLTIEVPETVYIEKIESGLINSTFKVEISSIGQYVLQQINLEVFANPTGIQQNIESVGKYLQERNYPKLVLSIVRTVRNELIYIDQGKETATWRMFHYIPESSHFNVVPSIDHAFEAAKSLGEFHQQLSDFDANTLSIPIQGFLDFEWRRTHFEMALKNSNQQRKETAKDAIESITKHGSILEEYQKIESLLPKRVIHGDPKISNFLFKKEASEVLCLIDWDTVMQGSILYDFGDMVRSFTNRKQESDATSTPVFDAAIFSAIKEGYLVNQEKELSPVESEHLVLGAKTVVYIQAMRFLTDYLNNDTYFTTTYEEQNLDRTKNQIQLLEAILNHEKSSYHLITT